MGLLGCVTMISTRTTCLRKSVMCSANPGRMPKGSTPVTFVNLTNRRSWRRRTLRLKPPTSDSSNQTRARRPLLTLALALRLMWVLLRETVAICPHAAGVSQESQAVGAAIGLRTTAAAEAAVARRLRTVAAAAAAPPYGRCCCDPAPLYGNWTCSCGPATLNCRCGCCSRPGPPDLPPVLTP